MATEAIVPVNERWRRLNANTSQTQHVPLRANIASHQLCRERQPFWKSYDGLNLTCSDQCHGVLFHGTSTLQVCQGKPSHGNRKGRDSRLDISVFLRLHKQRPKIRPRPAQWLLKLLSQWMKGGEGWMPTRPKPNMCQYVPTWANIASHRFAEKDSRVDAKMWALLGAQGAN